jgi:hypothetical protein
MLGARPNPGESPPRGWMMIVCGCWARQSLVDWVGKARRTGREPSARAGSARTRAAAGGPQSNVLTRRHRWGPTRCRTRPPSPLRPHNSAGRIAKGANAYIAGLHWCVLWLCLCVGVPAGAGASTQTVAAGRPRGRAGPAPLPARAMVDQKCVDTLCKGGQRFFEREAHSPASAAPSGALRPRRKYTCTGGARQPTGAATFFFNSRQARYPHPEAAG